VAIQFEERDLMRAHAEYAEYRQRVPMLVPTLRTHVPVTQSVRAGHV
jgi:protein-S-isoprenylcysteine O-methyltransferase Ste14